MYGEATFLSFKDKIKDVLESEGLSYDVAKTLYQSEGMISLESVNVIQGAADEKTKAQILMDLLQGQIMEDKSRFKAVVSGMMEFADLKPIMEKMTCAEPSRISSSASLEAVIPFSNFVLNHGCHQAIYDAILPPTIPGKNVKFIMKLFERVPFQDNHSLGIELDMDMQVISVIETDYKGDSVRIRTELINHWINNAKGNASLNYLKVVAKKLAPSVYPSLWKLVLVVILSLVALFIIIISAALLAPFMVDTGDQSIDSKLSIIPSLKQLVHKIIPLLSGTNIYIKPLPTIRKKMYGRDEKLKKIIHYVVSENSNIMIVGAPGFGKSTLAIHAGHHLKKEEHFDTSYVDAREHFSKTHTLDLLAIEQFFGILAGWCKERTKKTILVLDNFDVLLTDKRKEQLFQKNFLSSIESAHGNLSLIVTTHKETLNDDFSMIRANELSRDASMELLSLSKVKMSHSERNDTAGLIEDCPLALQVVLKLMDMAQSRKIADPVKYVINKLNESKIQGKISSEISDKRLKDAENYNYIMSLAFNQLGKQPQCCGCCISDYPGSFSEVLFPIIADHYGVPCNDSAFKDCVDDLVQNSLLDLFSYEEDKKSRYKMHTLIQSYFYRKLKNSLHKCEKSYRFMFSLLFSKCCALSYYYTERDLNDANQVLISEYHHFKRLLSYIFRTGSLNKYEGAVLMIAHQRKEIQSKYGYKILFEAVCKCKECAEYSKSLMGIEAFGSIVKNVSEKIYNFNFLRCDLMSDNFCSKELLNTPLNYTSHDHLSSSDVRTVLCTCYLMSRFHIMGTLSVLGALPLLYLLTMVKFIPLRVKVDTSMIVFIYMSFLPSILKLYYSSEFQRMLFNIPTSPVLQLMFAQLLYEGVLILVMGHMLQQREVLYATSVKIRNIAMLLIYIVLVMALLWSDLLGMYTSEAVKLSLGIIIALFGARYTLFDYVMRKISSSIFLRFFLRFILGLLSLSSLFLCQTFYLETSFIIHSILWFVLIFYMVVFSGLTIPLFYYLEIMTFK